MPVGETSVLSATVTELSVRFPPEYAILPYMSACLEDEVNRR